MLVYDGQSSAGLSVVTTWVRGPLVIFLCYQAAQLLRPQHTSTHTRTRTCPASASSTPRLQCPRQRGASATRSRSPSSHAWPIIGSWKMQEIKKRSRRRALLEDARCDCWRITSRHLIVTCWCRVSAKTRRRRGAAFTCRGMSSFGLHFVLRRRRHVLTEHRSAGRRRAERRGLDSWTNLSESVDRASAWIVNVAFSWALFGNEARWRHCRSGWLEERDDVTAARPPEQ